MAKTKQTTIDAPYKLKLLVSIVNRSKLDFYLSVLQGYEVNLQMVSYGMGTAPSQIQEMLGLNDNKKAVIISIVKESHLKQILADYEDKYFKTKGGKGIAFTIPISSLIGANLYQFLINKKGLGI